MRLIDSLFKNMFGQKINKFAGAYILFSWIKIQSPHLRFDSDPHPV